MVDCQSVPFASLPVWTRPTQDAETPYRNALRRFDRKIVVLDDDPTGTQTVHGVSVYTDWSYESILRGFQEDNSMFFLLTNSRGFTAAHSREVHQEIGENISRAAKSTGRDFVIISRGDSTMRGHWPLETQVLADTVAQACGKKYDGEILMPFFQEGNRYTFGNVHYVKEGDRLVPAGKTEFAKDKTFGYVSSDLRDWCEEKTAGAYPASGCICISLEDIRAIAIDKITAQLNAASHFAKIIVNAVSYEDVKVFCAAYIRSLQSGKEFMFRTAAAWTRVLGGISGRPLLTHDELVSDRTMGGIVLVGSHVQKTTLQLQNLQSSGLPIHFIEFDATLVTSPGGLDGEVQRVVAAAEERISRGETVAVYTTRKRIDFAGLDKEQQLQMSVAISDAVTSVIGRLSVRPSFIVAKGGITSSDVGTKALHVRKATVMGQIMPGIPVWMTGAESKFPGMPYVIFPGNVGDTETLTAAVRVLMDRA